MRKTNIVLMLCVLFCWTCSAQKESSKLIWKNFDFSDAGIKVSLPCEPSKSVKTFQEEPKLAQVYKYSCEKEVLKFSISLAEHFGEFSQSEVKDAIDGVERVMREGIKNNANISTKDTIFQTYSAREFDIKNETMLARNLHVQNKRGAYNVQMIFQRKQNQSDEDFNTEFQSTAQKLFESFRTFSN
jgi:hypothetical protein